jgi:uncharacterized protein (TIGR02466 family)
MKNIIIQKKESSDLSHTIEVANPFQTAIYQLMCPEFLVLTNKVSDEKLTKEAPPKIDDIYPHVMSENYVDDPRLKDFFELVGVSAWNILSDQGYNMQDKEVFFNEVWTQVHYKSSGMEKHIHAYASLVGFYFLEVPKDSSLVLFHDPRMGPAFVDLVETDPTKITLASQVITFPPREGMLMLSNAWLPHSFSRHRAEKPLKFIHFSISARDIQNIVAKEPLVEII